MNPDRALCGYVVTFGRPVTGRLGGTTTLAAEHFAGFLAARAGVPLRVDHEPLIRASGVVDRVGACRRWAALPARQGLPGRLLMLGEVSDDPTLASLLAADAAGMTRSLRLGFSIGAAFDGVAAWLTEVSITSQPADPGALMLAVGPTALSTWDALTGAAEVAVPR